MDIRKRFRGCLLGGAIGDALGYPIEFMTLQQILAAHGAHGVQTFSGGALISDDTQMTLFTTEGLLRAPEGDESRTLKSVYDAYQRWLITQTARTDGMKEDGGLLSDSRLHARRAPGHTCMSALMSGRAGDVDHPINNSKGCGGVMRAAPCGLQARLPAFRLGCRTAALTHSDPGAYLSAGAAAHMVRLLLNGATPAQCVQGALSELTQWPRHEETADVLRQAVHLAEGGAPTAEKAEALGGGWIGDEALAIAVYAMLCFPNDFKAAVLLSVNHSGDSDSTGSICGNLMGAHLGEDALPGAWRHDVELSDQITRLADELAAQY